MVCLVDLLGVCARLGSTQQWPVNAWWMTDIEPSYLMGIWYDMYVCVYMYICMYIMYMYMYIMYMYMYIMYMYIYVYIYIYIYIYMYIYIYHMNVKIFHDIPQPPAIWMSTPWLQTCKLTKHPFFPRGAFKIEVRGSCWITRPRPLCWTKAWKIKAFWARPACAVPMPPPTSLKRCVSRLATKFCPWMWG